MKTIAVSIIVLLLSHTDVCLSASGFDQHKNRTKVFDVLMQKFQDLHLGEQSDGPDFTQTTTLQQNVRLHAGSVHII